MNWTARFIHGTEDLSDAYAVRIEVFCDEQGYRLEQELDELDRRPDTWHLVLYDGGYPAAAGYPPSYRTRCQVSGRRSSSSSSCSSRYPCSSQNTSIRTA